MLIFILLLHFVLQGNGPPVDTVNLQILHKDKIVGQFSAQRSKIGEFTVYQSRSTVASQIIRLEVTYEIKVVLHEGVLEESDLKMTINGKLKTYSQTKRDGEIYTFSKNGKVKGRVNAVINHTTIMLYFGEPIEVSKTYSEERGNFCEILCIEPETYQKINSNGKTNTYRYSDNMLTHLLIENSLINFEMISGISDHQQEVN